MKKTVIHSETAYLIAIVMLAFSTAMVASTDFGVSMIAAPAYVMSLKFTFFTFGQCEYIIQAILMIAFCIIVKKVKLVYFTSFITGILYGAALDFFRMIIPLFNPEVTAAGSYSLVARIVFFVCGMFLTATSIAIFFKTYLYPQVYDFFVKAVSKHFNLDRIKFKRIFDLSMLTVASGMTLAFFGKFEGIGIGTLVVTAFNGVLIGIMGKVLDKFVIIKPYFEKFSEKFETE